MKVNENKKFQVVEDFLLPSFVFTHVFEYSSTRATCQRQHNEQTGTWNEMKNISIFYAACCVR